MSPLIATCGVCAAIVLMFGGLISVNSAGSIENLSIRCLSKVGFGVILILSSFALLWVSLDILDGI